MKLGAHVTCGSDLVPSNTSVAFPLLGSNFVAVDWSSILFLVLGGRLP